VQHGQAGQGGDADAEHRLTGVARGQQDDRHEEHDADLEEQRDADESRDAAHHPGQLRR
jgi:hypothetical protein